MCLQKKTLKHCEDQVLIVDLDDTLVETTRLNNDAYDYACNEVGLLYSKKQDRITRNDLSGITKEIQSEIVKLKQVYFSQKWLKYRVTVNSKLIKKLHQNNSNNNYLWTASDPWRAKNIVKQLGLEELFNKIVFDGKTDIVKSIFNLQEVARGNTFTVYENDQNIIKEIVGLQHAKCKIVDKICDEVFDVVGLRMEMPLKIAQNKLSVVYFC